jgi:hypothetical protein
VIELLRFVLAILASPFRSKARLEAEIATLRQQLIVLQRKSRGRVRLNNVDRLFFVQLYGWFPSMLQWKSRNRGGRPRIDIELRALIGQMSLENPLWGAPRIHGEL